MLAQLVAQLPSTWRPYAKGIVSVLAAVVLVAGALAAVLPPWALALVAALSPLLVVATPAPGYLPPDAAETPA